MSLRDMDEADAELLSVPRVLFPVFAGHLGHQNSGLP
jgi:hypothetical protein